MENLRDSDSTSGKMGQHLQGNFQGDLNTAKGNGVEKLILIFLALDATHTKDNTLWTKSMEWATLNGKAETLMLVYTKMTSVMDMEL